MPRGSAVGRQLSQQGPRSAADGEVVVEVGPTDPHGHLEPPAAGKVVLSVPSPEALAREPEAVGRVISHAGTGLDPLVLVVESAEELHEEELAAVLQAASHASRPVILRILRDG